MALVEDNFEKLFDIDDNMNTEKIISSFYEPKNINMKTEIPKKIVIQIAVLEAYAFELKKMGLTKSYKMIIKILDLFKELMVSGDREGRKEAMTMLNAVKEQVKQGGVLSKLLGVDKG